VGVKILLGVDVKRPREEILREGSKKPPEMKCACMNGVASTRAFQSLPSSSEVVPPAGPADPSSVQALLGSFVLSD